LQNVLVMLAHTGTGLVETWWISRLGAARITGTDRSTESRVKRTPLWWRRMMAARRAVRLRVAKETCFPQNRHPATRLWLATDHGRMLAKISPLV